MVEDLFFCFWTSYLLILFFVLSFGPRQCLSCMYRSPFYYKIVVCEEKLKGFVGLIDDLIS